MAATIWYEKDADLSVFDGKIAEHADKVIVINQGELAFDGTPLDLFSQKELTLKLGLELPEAVCISQELGLDICLTPMEIYAHLHKRG